MKQFGTIQDLTGAIYYDMLPKISTGYKSWDDAQSAVDTEFHIIETMTAIETALNILGWNVIESIEVCTVETPDNEGDFIVFSEAQTTINDMKSLLNEAGYDNVTFTPDLFSKYDDEIIAYNGWTTIYVYKNEKIMIVSDIDCGGGMFAIKFK